MRDTKRLLRKIALPLLLFCLACHKDNRTLDAGVLPRDGQLNALSLSDLEVDAYSKGPDSIPSFNDRYKYLGCNRDPQFGIVNIGLYLNANTTLSNITFRNAIFQSAEIILATDIFNIAGDSTAALTYSIFPIDSTLTPTRVYYTSNSRLHSKTPIGQSYTGKPSFLLGRKVIRIPVDNAFATALMADTNNLTSNDVFQAKYKGFYIAASAASEGSVYRCDLEDAVSGFYLYFKTPLTGDSINQFQFAFGGDKATRFNTVKYDPSGGNPLLVQQLSGDSTAGKQNLFVKGMGIAKLNLRLPFLKDYGDTFRVAVNRAEVIFYLDPAFMNSGNYLLPPALALLPIATSGRDTFALDQTNSTDNLRYNGVYQADINAYVFNIVRHAQAIMNGKIRNRGFHLQVSTPDMLTAPRRDNFIERAVLYGTGQPDLHPKLNISYLRLNK